MPPQSLLRIIKRWRRYEERADRRYVLPITRGIYVLYAKQPSRASKEVFHVRYIGVSGLTKSPKSGIGSRLRSHEAKRKDWTHFSFFEVHDNVSLEEVRELENLLLSIFRHDPRIQIENKQKSSKIFYNLRKSKVWPEVKPRRKRRVV